jgi:transmembrane sensor
MNLSMEKSSQTEEQAARWLLKRDTAGWSDADQQALDAWLESSTANTVAFLRLEAAWQEMRRLKAFSAGRAKGSVPSPDDWQFTPFFDEHQSGAGLATALGATPDHRRRRLYRALAATLILGLIGGTTWYLWPAGPVYQTPVGGTASVPMQDGSKVTLNTNTRIQVALTERERGVQLEHGEAFFEVAKDPTRPFVVSAGGKRIIAVGTKFSVEREADEVRVVVSEGTVRIENSAASRAVNSVRSSDGGANKAGTARLEGETQAAGDENLAGEGVMVSAGAVARAQGGSVLVQERPLSEIIDDLSWRSGYLVFHDVPLTEAVAEFNRYNMRKIEIDDSTVASIKVSGKFRSTNFEAFVRLLEDGFAIHAQTTDDQIILTKR